MFSVEPLELFRYAAQILIFVSFAGYVALCGILAAVLIGKVLIGAAIQASEKLSSRFREANSKQPEETASRREKKLCSG